MPFENREHAARLLVERLKKYRGKNPLVLGIPRGGVVMAAAIASELGGEVDVVLVHKLGAPGEPEFAIGAVDESGQVYVSSAVDRMGIPDSYIDGERQAQLKVLRGRRKQYTPVRPPIEPEGRIVIVVDDGLATGATMIAALRALRARKPRQLIAAIGVAPAETLERVGELADEAVCLEVPEPFFAVGHHFEDFRQVEDEEVMVLLKQHGPKAADYDGRE